MHLKHYNLCALAFYLGKICSIAQNVRRFTKKRHSRFLDLGLPVHVYCPEVTTGQISRSKYYSMGNRHDPARRSVHVWALLLPSDTSGFVIYLFLMFMRVAHDTFL
jgi:hypothetical protein